MSPTSLHRRRPWAAEKPSRRRPRVDRMRVSLDPSAATSLHVASYERDAFLLRVVVLERPAPLVRWCREQGVRDAVVGGFFSRAQYLPLGQVRIGGEPLPSLPFDAPWGDRRACVQIADRGLRIARRDELGPHPAGDLLQAGPLLVAGGRPALADGDDAEGFAAGAYQFDSDITDGRYPRAALAIAGDRVLTLACDGRTRRDAGMTLRELAETLVKLGVTDALNLDGGGSASLVCDGRLRNRPREKHGVDLIDGRPIVTAVVLEPR